MIGVDTDILIRYLVQDGGPAGRGGRRLPRAALLPGSPGLRQPGRCRGVRAGARSRPPQPAAHDRLNLADLLRTAVIRVEDADNLGEALRLYRDGAGFTDAIIGVSNARQGCSATATLDRKARRLPMFEAP